MSWYVVNTKPRQERVAEHNIKQLGLETFLPQLKENRLIRRKIKTILGPLFPGYFFVRFDVNTHYRAVHFSHGVRGVVSYGAIPAKVDEALIAMIKSKTKSNCVVIKPPRIKAGEAVRIQTGPFEGFEAIFRREVAAQRRVVLLLKTLSCQPQVIVDRESIEAC